jgi:hypothetical protein
MKCCDVEQVLQELLDGEPDSAFEAGAFEVRPSEVGSSEHTVEMRLAASDVEAHLKSCPACAELAADLKLISSQARHMAASEEPPSRVWVRIAAELRAEGLISEPTVSHPTNRQPVPIRPTSVPVLTASRSRWSPWWLAPIAAGLIVAGSYVVSHQPALQVARQTPATPLTNPATVTSSVSVPVTKTAAATSTSVPTPVRQQLAQKSTQPTGLPDTAAGQAVEPAPGNEDQRADDQQFLSVVSTMAPYTRATYKNELQAVNADIQETQAYVNRNPWDLDARQHLMDSYQQKALLYQIALDHVQ